MGPGRYMQSVPPGTGQSSKMVFLCRLLFGEPRERDSAILIPAHVARFLGAFSDCIMLCLSEVCSANPA